MQGYRRKRKAKAVASGATRNRRAFRRIPQIPGCGGTDRAAAARPGTTTRRRPESTPDSSMVKESKSVRLALRITFGRNWWQHADKNERKKEARRIVQQINALRGEEWTPTSFGTPTPAEIELVKQAHSMITGAASAPAQAPAPDTERRYTLGAGRPGTPPAQKKGARAQSPTLAIFEAQTPRPARITRNIFGQYGDKEKTYPIQPAHKHACAKTRDWLAGHKITACMINKDGDITEVEYNHNQIRKSTSPGDNCFTYDRQKCAWVGPVATVGRQFGVTRKRAMITQRALLEYMQLEVRSQPLGKVGHGTTFYPAEFDAPGLCCTGIHRPVNDLVATHYFDPELKFSNERPYIQRVPNGDPYVTGPYLRGASGQVVFPHSVVSEKYFQRVAEDKAANPGNHGNLPCDTDSQVYVWGIRDGDEVNSRYAVPRRLSELQDEVREFTPARDAPPTPASAAKRARPDEAGGAGESPAKRARQQHA